MDGRRLIPGSGKACLCHHVQKFLWDLHSLQPVAAHLERALTPYVCLSVRIRNHYAAMEN